MKMLQIVILFDSLISIHYSYFISCIAKDTTVKYPPKQKKSLTNDVNAILTPVFHRIDLDNASVFLYKV